MGCTYVKEFDFGGKKSPAVAKAAGGAVKKYAVGGKVHSDVAMDKKAVKTAVHKHEKAMHKGEPLTKLKRGGPVMEKATGEKYPSREAMVRHEAKETPRMQREELVQRSKVVAPARRSVPVASREPMLAMKKGGKASMC